MKLFHYHHWTPMVEDMEKTYRVNGYAVAGRYGKYENRMQTFHPPLTWDDFRNKQIIFRIIEMRRGSVNVTFGYGKRNMFDHIGFLLNSNQQHKDDLIVSRANELGFSIDRNERRTFISVPDAFRIELQTNTDAIIDYSVNITRMDIEVRNTEVIGTLAYLLDLKREKNSLYGDGWEINLAKGVTTSLQSIYLNNGDKKAFTDQTNVTTYI
ncbi:hypothetical protein [Paenibacillus alkalitolerans]|uniref:hypothetical protein n=1 Tax=Paenibacillus alkalitolerans TaxID=2799335 RepID=UPI0018F458A4|nr:hypothetical protein [Paenibacillus alkalitolerans]